MSIFDREREQAFRGCPVCGAKATVRMNATIQKLGAKREPGKSVGRSVSLCEEHGEALFLRIEADIQATRNGRP